MADTRTHKRPTKNRKHGTLEIFERYWVYGESQHSMGTVIRQRGIPTRSQRDASALRHGEVNVDDLWDKYLTAFQTELAKELLALRVHDA